MSNNFSQMLCSSHYLLFIIFVLPQNWFPVSKLRAYNQFLACLPSLRGPVPAKQCLGFKQLRSTAKIII